MTIAIRQLPKVRVDLSAKVANVGMTSVYLSLFLLVAAKAIKLGFNKEHQLDETT